MSDNKVKEKIEDRKSEFKRGITSDDVRDNRYRDAMSLRKDKRQEKLNLCRRREASPSAVKETMDAMMHGVNPEKQSIIDIVARLEQLAQGVCQDQDQASFEQSLEWLRVISASQYITPSVYLNPVFLNRMAELAVVPDVQVADKALTILTNTVMIHNSLHECVRHGHVIDVAVTLLGNQQTPIVIRSSCAWLVANVVSVDYEVRDLAINANVADFLAQDIKRICAQYADADFWPHEAMDLLENGYWAISNFFKGRELPLFEKLSLPLQVIRDGIFFDENHADVQRYSVYAIAYALRDMLMQEEMLRDAEAVQRLSLLTMGQENSVAMGALRCLGQLCVYENRVINIPGSDAPQLMCPPLDRVLLGASIISVIQNALSAPDSRIRQEACYIAANLALTSWQCMWEMHQNGIVDRLVEMNRQETFSVRGEAAKALCTSIHACIREGKGTAGQQLYSELIHGRARVIFNLARDLDNPKHSVREEVTRVFYAILKRAAVTDIAQNSSEPIVDMFEESGALAALQKMASEETIDIIGRLAEKCLMECERVRGNLEESDGVLELMHESHPVGGWGQAAFSF